MVNTLSTCPSSKLSARQKVLLLEHNLLLTEHQTCYRWQARHSCCLWDIVVLAQKVLVEAAIVDPHGAAWQWQSCIIMFVRPLQMMLNVQSAIL